MSLVLLKIADVYRKMASVMNTAVVLRTVNISSWDVIVQWPAVSNTSVCVANLLDNAPLESVQITASKHLQK